MLYAVHKLYLLRPVLIALLAIWRVLDLLCCHHLVALSYSRKVTKAFSLTPSGYEMAAKTVVLGLRLKPRIAIQRLNTNLLHLNF